MIKVREIYKNGQLIKTESFDDGVSASRHLELYRWQKEIGGVEYLGKIIQTDRETRANWIGILIQAQSNPSYMVTWKTSDGSFVVYNAEQAIGAAMAVSNHVQKCFQAEALISTNTYKTLSELQLAFEEAYNGD